MPQCRYTYIAAFLYRDHLKALPPDSLQLEHVLLALRRFLSSESNVLVVVLDLTRISGNYVLPHKQQEHKCLRAGCTNRMKLSLRLRYSSKKEV
jgi:hypothetical protein